MSSLDAPSQTTHGLMPSGILVSALGLLLLITGGGLIVLALYAAGQVALLPNSAEYSYIPVILSIGAVVTFAFGLLVVAVGLWRLLRHPKA